MSLKEGAHRGEFIISEANGYGSRDQRTLKAGQKLPAGRVLGQITASGKFVELAPSASDGSQVAAAILYDNVDASSTGSNADTLCTVISRNAEVRDGTLLQNELVTLFDSISWPAGITGPQTATATNDLLARGIVIRSGGDN